MVRQIRENLEMLGQFVDGTPGPDSLSTQLDIPRAAMDAYLQSRIFSEARALLDSSVHTVKTTSSLYEQLKMVPIEHHDGWVSALVEPQTEIGRAHV